MASVEENAKRFMQRFNEDDLEGIIETLSPAAVYVDPFGATFVGRDSVRESLSPYFGGKAGAVRYDVDEIIADEAGGRALVTWVMRIASPDATSRIEGLDILHFEGDQIRRKNSFCKAVQVRAQ